MAIGPVIEGRAQRDVWFEVNGEVRAVSVEDKNSAVETVSRERATSDPGSVGAPMSGVVVEVRVKEGQEIKKGDPICGAYTPCQTCFAAVADEFDSRCSHERHEGTVSPRCVRELGADRFDRWSLLSRPPSLVTSSASSSTKVSRPSRLCTVRCAHRAARRRFHQPGRPGHRNRALSFPFSLPHTFGRHGHPSHSNSNGTGVSVFLSEIERKKERPPCCCSCNIQVCTSPRPTEVPSQYKFVFFVHLSSFISHVIGAQPELRARLNGGKGAGGGPICVHVFLVLRRCTQRCRRHSVSWCCARTTAATRTSADAGRPLCAVCRSGAGARPPHGRARWCDLCIAIGGCVKSGFGFASASENKGWSVQENSVHIRARAVRVIVRRVNVQFRKRHTTRPERGLSQGAPASPAVAVPSRRAAARRAPAHTPSAAHPSRNTHRRTRAPATSRMRPTPVPAHTTA